MSADSDQCPVCESSLYLAASPSLDQSQNDQRPEHLQGHNCCLTKCGHLIHSRCMSGEFGKAAPACPVCKNGITPAECNPLDLPTGPEPPPIQRTPPSSRTSLQDRLVSITRGLSFEIRKPPLFLFHVKTSRDSTSQPPPAKRARTDSDMATGDASNRSSVSAPSAGPPMDPFDKVSVILGDPSLELITAIYRLGQHIDPEGISVTIQEHLASLAARLQKYSGNDTAHFLLALPAQINWLLDQDRDEIENWLENWNGHLETFQNFLNRQPWKGELPQNPEPFVLVPLSEVVSAARTLGTANFFRALNLYKHLNRNGLVDVVQSRVYQLLPQLIQILENEENIETFLIQFFTWVCTFDRHDIRDWVDTFFGQANDFLDLVEQQAPPK